MVDLQRPVTVPTTPAPAARAHVRPRLRAVSAAVVSTLVVLAAAFYVLAPADASVRLSVDEAAGAQPYDATAAAQYTLVSARHQRPHHRRPAHTEIVYGKISARGIPVSRISLRFTGAERRTRGHGATIRIARANVAYRTVLHLRPGRYRATLTLRVGHRYKTRTVVRRIVDRRYYRVSASVRPSGIVTFLPVTSY